MEEIKGGKFLREENGVDPALEAVLGDHYQDRTKEIPMDAEVEPAEDAECPGVWTSVKHAALFLGLTAGIVVCENLGLMAEVIAVPGMLVCAACFGWNARGC